MPEEPQPPPEPEKKAPLYKRVGHWLRQRDKGDIVIGEVGPGAHNIIIGKNNVQINFGGRLLTVPIWLIAIASVAIVAILSLPFIEAYLHPLKMSSQMNIAIAEFGQIEPDGRVDRSTLGYDISRMVFDKLANEYQDAYSNLTSIEGKSVEIWHDSQSSQDDQRNEVNHPRLGLLTGTTPSKRAEQASELAQKINADIVIYGNLIQDGDKRALQIEFYHAGGILRGEPDAIAGRHVLSQLITVPANIEQEPMAVKNLLDTPINLRARLLFWLTFALILDVTDQQKEALAVLQAAKQSFAGWEDKDGQALLHYLIGREAYWLRQHDVAIAALQEAAHYKEDYPNVYITLAAIHYDRAQLFYISEPIPESQVECISPQDLKHAAQSPEEAMREIDLAVHYLDQAVAIAPDSAWKPIEWTARLVRGNAYRLKGQAYLLAAEHALARPWFEDALKEFALVEQVYSEAEQQQYLAWTHLGMAATYYMQAYASLASVTLGDDTATQMRKRQQAAALFEQADKTCQACLDEGEAVGDMVYQRVVIRCGCEYVQKLAQTDYVAVQKLIEEQ